MTISTTRMRLATLCLAAATALLAAEPARAEVFLDFGFHSTRVEADIANAPATTETSTGGAHLGLGVRRELERGSDMFQLVGPRHTQFVSRARHVARGQAGDLHSRSGAACMTVVTTEAFGGRARVEAPATTSFKPARLETGITVQVPPFVNVGERIKVDTNEGKYMERA